MASLRPWSFPSLLLVCSILCLVAGQNSLSLHPASIPLAVRSSYLNVWLPTLSNASAPPQTYVWPQLWHDQNAGCVGFLMVNGDTYQWLGYDKADPATVIGSSITPTQTTFRMRAGPIEFNATFLSPVEPSDWTRQSFPFSYISVDVESRDGRAHSVQFYLDVTSDWISPGRNGSVRSTTTRTKSTVFHSMTRSNPAPMVEEEDVALDAGLILAAINSNSVSIQTGPADPIRDFFNLNDRLTNEEFGLDTPITPSNPIISISIDLGKSLVRTSSPVVFGLGILRDPIIHYGKESQTDRRPYFLAKWPTIDAAIDDFMSEFTLAQSRANSLDERIMSEARAEGGTQYADLVGLSLRQTMAAVDITTSQKLSSTRVKSFMKDIGETSRANPVNTLYASLPALLYLNASLVGTLLDSLLDEPSARGFASPDLGSGYPVAVLNDSSSTTALAVDSCASMLIMSLAHAQKSGEGFLLSRYDNDLKTWADFLVENAIRPTEFVTSDGRQEPNNADLALKGILGIYSMGVISKELEGQGKSSSSTTSHYNTKAQELYKEWEPLGFASGRVISTYGQTESWSVAPSLYLAKLLGATFVGEEIYSSHTAFLGSQLTSSGGRFGLGYDSNAENTVKSHWTMFAAAAMTDTTTRNRFINALHNRTFMTGATSPPSTSWDARSGVSIGGAASPAHGAMFALLALKIPNLPVQFSSAAGAGDETGSTPSTGSSTSQTSPGTIAGGVIGGVLALALVTATVFLLRRHRRRQSREVHETGDTKLEIPRGSMVVPFVVASRPREHKDHDTESLKSHSTTTGGTHPTNPSFNSDRKIAFTRSHHVAGQKSSMSTLRSLGPSYVSGAPTNPSPTAASASSVYADASSVARTSSVFGDHIGGVARKNSTSKPDPPLSRSTGGEDELRTEVLALRREMDQIRLRATLHPQQIYTRNSIVDNPPPSYTYAP